MAKERRLLLHEFLKGALGSGVTVYFQPPENVSMSYPALRYERDDEDVSHADNVPYRRTPRYQLMYITRDPDDPVLDKLSDLPMCSFSRAYPADNLYHNVYTMYF